MVDLSSRLSKALAACVGSVAAAQLFTFIALITPAWQVAEDLDINRNVQSGLWLYCPGSSQCWYIFSDDVVNYYEKVDVCRFLLIGDCRKKLVRTPYFFGWHYAVLALVIVALCFGLASMITAGFGLLSRKRIRLVTILLDVFVFMDFLVLAIGLLVFAINAEMLESKYLIGVKNTFEKHYGYSFFLASFALLILSFSSLAAIMLTAIVFFTSEARHFQAKSSETMQYIDRPATRPQLAMHDGHVQASSVAFPQTFSSEHLFGDLPQRSVTPLSKEPSVCGQYIAPQFRNGQFQPTTRHFYSY